MLKTNDLAMPETRCFDDQLVTGREKQKMIIPKEGWMRERGQELSNQDAIFVPINVTADGD